MHIIYIYHMCIYIYISIYMQGYCIEAYIVYMYLLRSSTIRTSILQHLEQLTAVLKVNYGVNTLDFAQLKLNPSLRRISANP